MNPLDNVILTTYNAADGMLNNPFDVIKWERHRNWNGKLARILSHPHSHSYIQVVIYQTKGHSPLWLVSSVAPIPVKDSDKTAWPKLHSDVANHRANL
jgi:hypothetical protein